SGLNLMRHLHTHERVDAQVCKTAVIPDLMQLEARQVCENFLDFRNNIYARGFRSLLGFRRHGLTTRYRLEVDVPEWQLCLQRPRFINDGCLGSWLGVYPWREPSQESLHRTFGDLDKANAKDSLNQRAIVRVVHKHVSQECLF